MKRVDRLRLIVLIACVALFNFVCGFVVGRRNSVHNLDAVAICVALLIVISGLFRVLRLFNEMLENRKLEPGRAFKSEEKETAGKQ